MQWTKGHDVLLYREVLALEPYKNKKGSSEAGRIWTDITQSLKSCKQIEFKKNLSQRAVRERFTPLQAKFKEKENEDMRSSGISPEQEELDVLVEDITERDEVSIESKENADEKRENDKATAEEIRKQAMERMEETKKKKSQEEDEGGIKVIPPKYN